MKSIIQYFIEVCVKEIEKSMEKILNNEGIWEEVAAIELEFFRTICHNNCREF